MMVEPAKQSKRPQASIDLKQLTLQRSQSFTLQEKAREMFTFRALRSLVLGFVSIVLLLGLFQSIRSRSMPHSSLEVLEDIKSATWRTPHTHRVKKVTALLGDRNDIYEAAVKTHERQNSLHGYEMEILRERIVSSYWSKPTYLLAQVVEEMAKPAGMRNEWIM